MPSLYYLPLILFLLLPYSPTQAMEWQAEVGSSRSVFNYFQKPNLDSNRLNLPDATGISYRVTGKIGVTSSTFLYLLVAPLTLNYTTRNPNNFNFNSTSFSGHTSTEVSYQFNSYRAGYMWRFESKNWQYWLGPVAKIRDAEIKVSQPGLSDSFSNVGFVPLLGAGIQYAPSESWALYAHLDGSYAPQGSAYDGVIELRFRLLNSLKGALGYRMLGGGADNDTLTNFAQFDTLTLSLIYQ